MIVDVTLSTGVELTVFAHLERDFDRRRDYVDDYRVIACKGKRVRPNVTLSAKADQEIIPLIEEQISC